MASAMAYSNIQLAADRIKAFCQIPALTPSRKRLKTVLHLPNSSGQSRQGLPVRTIHSAASASQAPVRASLALHRQACPGSARPSVPTACRSILIFPWRNCCTRGRFSTGPKRKRLVRHACGLGLSGYIKNRSKLKGFKYRFALVSLRRYAMN